MLYDDADSRREIDTVVRNASVDTRDRAVTPSHIFYTKALGLMGSYSHSIVISACVLRRMMTVWPVRMMRSSRSW
ncbi:hypothetical protein DOTSEDRAFT_69337 [Dothistroma septosporum NZE10]|uniref:Uncharacterized protein n=1 Tax=Dothistroma septosporum (strain NZE10 / CBS 128990) TaxID=675120 RepID=N1PY83_DOTSN|nr:hypothetical protein DOTSEDRAFT_69337 [Dothistroma septosporum NZE10]